MSSYELAERIGLSPTRARELEKAEVDGSIRLSMLHRIAEGLGCSLFYVFEPKESLELMVLRQAELKAARKLAARDLESARREQEELDEVAVRQQFDAVALGCMDRQGFWR